MRAFRRFAYAAVLLALPLATGHCSSDNAGSGAQAGSAGAATSGQGGSNVTGAGTGGTTGGATAGTMTGGTAGGVTVQMGGEAGQRSDSNIKTSQPDPSTLIVEWNDKAGARYQAELNLSGSGALFRKLAQAPDASAPFVTIATDVDTKFRITAGTRKLAAGKLREAAKELLHGKRSSKRK